MKATAKKSAKTRRRKRALSPEFEETISKKPLAYPAAFYLPVMDVVCGVIVDGVGRVLICQRGNGRDLAGLWEFPGGKVEAGETPADGLTRELEEELGIIVEVGRRLTVVQWEGLRGPLTLMPFFCKIVSGKPRAIEHLQIVWSDFKNLSSYCWAPADQPVIKELLSLKDFSDASPA